MRVTDNHITLCDALVFMAFFPVFAALFCSDLISQRLRRPQPVRSKPKAKRKPRVIKTAKAHRNHYGVSPALRIINGGRA